MEMLRELMLVTQMVHWRALPWGLKLEMVLVFLLDETYPQESSDLYFV